MDESLNFNNMLPTKRPLRDNTNYQQRPRVEKALLITNGCQHYYKGGIRKKEEIFGDLG